LNAVFFASVNFAKMGSRYLRPVYGIKLLGDAIKIKNK